MNKDLTKILSDASEKKIYGSVEIFYENGVITQITQRIIKKVPKPISKETSQKSKVAIKNNSKNHSQALASTTLNSRI